MRCKSRQPGVALYGWWGQAGSKGDSRVGERVSVEIGAGGGVGDEADGGGEEEDPEPAGEREMLVQEEAADEGDDDVAEGGGRHDEGEVGPGEGGHVAGEEAYEEHDPRDDVWVCQSTHQQGEVMEVCGADLGHTAREQCVPEGCGEDYGEENGVLAGGEAMGHRSLVRP